MASVFDVAKYILCKTGKISTWKLQKLCYYAQAWHYTWTEHPLFSERFEAWQNGPVCPVLFSQHRGKFMIDKDDIDGNPDALSSDERDSVDIVIRDYGPMEPYDLRELSHSEAPWRDARQNVRDNQPSHNVISLDSMGAYYGSL